MSDTSEWVRANSEHLRPGDERFVRGYDSFTAGLVLMQVNYLRALDRALFGPHPAAADVASGRDVGAEGAAESHG